MGIEAFNAECRKSVLRVHRRVARVRHPAGALGRLRPRLQDPRPRLHGVGDVGLQAAVATRGWPTRASASCRTAGTTRPRCPTTSCGWTRTSTRCGRTRRSPSGCRLETGELAADLDDDARGRCRPTCDHGRPRHRLRRGRVRRHRHAPSGTSLGAARLAAYARELKNDDSESVVDQVVERLTGRDLLGRTLHAAVHLLPRASRTAHRVRRGRLRHHRGRHRAGAQSPAPSARRTRRSPTARASSRSCRWPRTARSPTRSPTTRACTSSTPTCAIIEHLKAR